MMNQMMSNLEEAMVAKSTAEQQYKVCGGAAQGGGGRRARGECVNESSSLHHRCLIAYAWQDALATMSAETMLKNKAQVALCGVTRS